MKYYTKDYMQGEQINPILYDTVCNNLQEVPKVMGGGQKTGWKLHMMGLKDVNILIEWIDACIPEAARIISGGESTDDYGASLFDERGLRIVECWGIHYNKGQYVTEHNHFPFALSFNYCVSAPEGSSHFILEEEEIETKPGRVVFFQSHMNHYIHPNKSDGRSMIVGNIVYDPQIILPLSLYQS